MMPLKLRRFRRWFWIWATAFLLVGACLVFWQALVWIAGPFWWSWG
jgi:hypothetical protein